MPPPTNLPPNRPLPHCSNRLQNIGGPPVFTRRPIIYRSSWMTASPLRNGITQSFVDFAVSKNVPICTYALKHVDYSTNPQSLDPALYQLYSSAIYAKTAPPLHHNHRPQGLLKQFSLGRDNYKVLKENHPQLPEQPAMSTTALGTTSRAFMAHINPSPAKATSIL